MMHIIMKPFQTKSNQRCHQPVFFYKYTCIFTHQHLLFDCTSLLAPIYTPSRIELKYLEFSSTYQDVDIPFELNLHNEVKQGLEPSQDRFLFYGLHEKSKTYP